MSALTVLGFDGCPQLLYALNLTIGTDADSRQDLCSAASTVLKVLPPRRHPKLPIGLAPRGLMADLAMECCDTSRRIPTWSSRAIQPEPSECSSELRTL